MLVYVMCHTCTLLFPKAKAWEVAGTAVNAMARIRAGRSGNWCSIPDKGRVPFISPQGSEWLRGPYSLQSNEYHDLFPRGKAAGLRT